MQNIRLELNLRGKVQGVFFRRFIQDKAPSYNLNGLAKNEPDGSLTVILEGPKDQVFRFLPILLEGPPLAKVKELTLHQKTPRGLKGFKVE